MTKMAGLLHSTAVVRILKEKVETRLGRRDPTLLPSLKVLTPQKWAWHVNIIIPYCKEKEDHQSDDESGDQEDSEDIAEQYGSDLESGELVNPFLPQLCNTGGEHKTTLTRADSDEGLLDSETLIGDIHDKDIGNPNVLSTEVIVSLLSIAWYYMVCIRWKQEWCRQAESCPLSSKVPRPSPMPNASPPLVHSTIFT